MRRIFLIILAMLLLFTAVSCSPAIAEEKTTAEKATEEASKTLPQTSEEDAPSYPKVHQTVTWDDINAIPVANADMSIEEIRKICIDFFRLQQTFQWTPSDQIDYVITTGERDVSLKTGQVYAGLPYRSGNKTGNLYILME